MGKNNKKYTLEEVREIVKEFGYELLSDEYINMKDKLVLKDKEGYFYYCSLNDFKQTHSASKFHPSNPYTIQNIRLFLSKAFHEFELISKDYLSSRQNIILKDSSEYYYTCLIGNLMQGKFPLRFGYSNSYTIQNIKLWLILNNKPFKLLSNKFISASENLKWQCLKDDCEEIFEMNWNHIMSGRGCPFCVGKQVGLSNCLATKNPELAKEWYSTKNGDLSPYDVTEYSNESVWWECNDCGHKWVAHICNRTGKIKSGCPECSKSKGEIKISEWLKLHNIHYIPQKTFDRLIGINSGLLSYDFYLPEYNILIEFQGEQHERYIPGFHSSKKKFEIQVEHDRRKREYAENNNIKLLEIWYWDFDSIEEILDNEINSKINQ